jgi:hypothetical protein
VQCADHVRKRLDSRFVQVRDMLRLDLSKPYRCLEFGEELTNRGSQLGGVKLLCTLGFCRVLLVSFRKLSPLLLHHRRTAWYQAGTLR